MDTDNQAENAASGEESFADMFEKSYVQRDRLEPGQMVETTIVNGRVVYERAKDDKLKRLLQEPPK